MSEYNNNGFESVVSRIGEMMEGTVSAGGSIASEKIADIVGTALASAGTGGSGGINCYPGKPGGTCHSLAFFMSLSSPRYRKPKAQGHFNLHQIMQKVVQHMQGHCVGKTMHAVVITDVWDLGVVDEWAGNLKAIGRSGATVEVYLLAGGGHIKKLW